MMSGHSTETNTRHTWDRITRSGEGRNFKQKTCTVMCVGHLPPHNIHTFSTDRSTGLLANKKSDNSITSEILVIQHQSVQSYFEVKICI